MKRTLMTTAAIFAVLCITATTYGLTDYQTDGDGSTWGDKNNWSEWDGEKWIDAVKYPGESGSTPGTVTVQHTMTVAVSDAKATVLDVDASLTINSGATVTAYSHVDVADSITVTIDGVSDVATLDIQESTSQTSTINPSGSIQINATNSTYYGQLLISGTGTHTIQGSSGAIQGNSDDALISIASGKNLDSTTNIVGHLEISGSGNFQNNGIVDANTSGTLLVNVTGTTSIGGSSGDWKATANGAKLEFGGNLDDNDSDNAISMSGDFVISNSAEIQIDELASLSSAFTTTGHLDISSGTLDSQGNVTMGSDGNPMNATGGSITVAPGMTFIHY